MQGSSEFESSFCIAWFGSDFGFNVAADEADIILIPILLLDPGVNGSAVWLNLIFFGDSNDFFSMNDSFMLSIMGLFFVSSKN